MWGEDKDGHVVGAVLTVGPPTSDCGMETGLFQVEGWLEANTALEEGA